MKCSVKTKGLVVLTYIGAMMLQNAYAVPKVIPVIKGLFSTGQWYSNGEKSSLAGNASLMIVPAVRFNTHFSVIPSFESAYRGTRSSEELAGGSTLFQDTWENSLGVKTIHGLSQNWKVKTRLNVKNKWFRETTDESWNKGLYDYRTYTAGVEGEYSVEKKWGLGFGYDFSLLRFPNYQSLESSEDDSLSREYASEHPLDATVHLFHSQATAKLPWSLNTQLQVFLSPRDFRDQTIVERSGLLSSSKRSDLYTGVNLNVERVFKSSQNSNLIPNLYYGYSKMDSNQNHYDARLTTFIGDYYDYTAHKVGSNITFAFGKGQGGPMTIDAGAAYSIRNYTQRPTQTTTGAYTSTKLYQQDTQVSFGFSYPLSKNFRLQTSSTFGRSKSNNDYEALYKYNYSNSNYQFGFTYDY